MPAAKKSLHVDHLAHDDATRLNNPSAEHKPLVDPATAAPICVEIERRNEDLDPQLVWRGKARGPLEVDAPPIYVQERIHPKHLIEDLERETARRKAGEEDDDEQLDLFADFNGVPEGEAKTEFYQHEAHWTNRMILGDALEVMTSLAERERLRGKVQCIYIDPPYGIKFNSNFQWSTTSRDVKDGKAEHITREPEQVRAFRDTWRDGIHSYLSYLRDRLVVARELLTVSGSCFVQIGDENVHRVRALMDEVFGEESFCSLINVKKTAYATSAILPSISDALVWYCKDKSILKYRQLLTKKERGDPGTINFDYIRHSDTLEEVKLSPSEPTPVAAEGRWEVYRLDNLMSTGYRTNTSVPYTHEGVEFKTGQQRNWKITLSGLDRAAKAGRLRIFGNSLSQVRNLRDFGVTNLDNMWADTVWPSFGEAKHYVVQTLSTIVQRCILMTTDPGDLVLDPTCGSGTTAYVAEQWGRRWITVDTSRVALALARTRLMGARYPWYLLADSREGQLKEAELTRKPAATTATTGRLRQGFVYERVPHITLKSIANNEEIDTTWQSFQPHLEALRQNINHARNRRYADESLGYNRDNPQMPPPPADADNPPFEEWTMPREPGAPWGANAQKVLAKAAKTTTSEKTRLKHLATLNGPARRRLHASLSSRTRCGVLGRRATR